MEENTVQVERSAPAPQDKSNYFGAIVASWHCLSERYCSFRAATSAEKQGSLIPVIPIIIIVTYVWTE
jgi:hypothetical protein